ncbi:MAG: hypothetical protein ACTSRK_10750 [Promethearchaeota archaeon]
MRTRSNQKEQYAIGLLQKEQSYNNIREELKAKFGSGMSYSDLSKLKNQIMTSNSSSIPYWKYFLDLYKIFYETLENLDTSWKSKIEENYNFHIFSKIYKEAQKKMKIETMLKNLPDHYKEDEKLIKSIRSGLEDIENGNLLTREELMSFKK